MVKKWFVFLAVTLVLFALCVPVTFAHDGDSLAYSDISIKDGVITYKLQLDMYDMRAGATQDDPDRQFTTPEELNRFVSNSRDEVEAFLLSQIKLYGDNLQLDGKLTQLNYVEKDNQPFAEAILEYPVRNNPQHFVLDYDLVFNMDEWHVNYVTLELGKLKQNAVLVNDLREFQVGQMSFGHAISTYFQLGLESFSFGFNHILFLLALLIGARSKKQLLMYIGSFAVAHSLTLIIVSLHILTLPHKFVESGIALSILYIALNNLLNKNKEQNIWLVSCFSLIHGFGFAEICSGMSNKGGHVAPALIAYNVGIVVSLVVIVLILYPLIHYIRRLNWAISAILIVLSLLGIFGLIGVYLA
ncbi:HupE/UreJ family protein [Paenibacillus qinlingensis]|uniref:HupE/UreJ family protein n=1 Tax=Paenibacillus qinlingensis TaxID=1837343 RepID=UPI001563DB64|nr:HupE/UreJ family protein [Paenibacillus qinlingensis]NQX59870.1 HupE/UreJ family protein [Paenibacillus qinlingensis]